MVERWICSKPKAESPSPFCACLRPLRPTSEISFNPNSEIQPRKGAKNTKETSRGWMEAGRFPTGPFSSQKLGFALLVPFRGHSLSECGFKPTIPIVGVATHPSQPTRRANPPTTDANAMSSHASQSSTHANRLSSDNNGASTHANPLSSAILAHLSEWIPAAGRSCHEYAGSTPRPHP